MLGPPCCRRPVLICWPASRPPDEIYSIPTVSARLSRTALSISSSTEKWSRFSGSRPGGSGPLFLTLAPLFQPLFERLELLAQRGDFLPECLGVLRRLGLPLRLALGRRGRQPPRPCAPFTEDAIGLTLARHDPLEARLERFLHEVLPALAMLDQLMQESRRQAGPTAALVLEDDLRQRHRGQVLAGRDVHDGELLAGADQLLQPLQRHVAVLLGVVELPIRVPLDDVRHAESLTLCVIGDREEQQVETIQFWRSRRWRAANGRHHWRASSSPAPRGR